MRQVITLKETVEDAIRDAEDLGVFLTVNFLEFRSAWREWGIFSICIIYAKVFVGIEEKYILVFYVLLYVLGVFLKVI